MTTVVSNATPLIALARIGRFDLLRDLYGEVLVTDAVVAELEAGGEAAPGFDETRKALGDGWLVACPIDSSRELTGLSVDLDVGEATTIMLAIDRQAALVLLDERKARARARALGLNVTGTIGTLLLAKERELMSDLASVLRSLQDAGFHVSSRLLETLTSDNS